MTEPFCEIRSVADAVAVGVELPDNWFRGHRKAVGKLSPRFHRDYDEPFFQHLKPQTEMELIEAFRRNAPAIADGDELPDEDDNLGWLYLMQHYKAPTRLLDWTENVLAALFFAVWHKDGRESSDDEEDDEADGELWGLRPYELNAEADVGRQIPLPGRNPVIDYMAQEPYWRDRQRLADKLAEEYRGLASSEWCRDPHPFEHPVAFRPRRDFERMRVQSSVFTIHPRSDTDETIPSLLPAAQQLVRYLIPGESKDQIRKELQALEVKDVTLFPDFEGLSRTIVPVDKSLGSPAPVPPTFDHCE